MTEVARKTRNEQRLGTLYPPFAERVRAIIGELETLGIRPRIQDGFRTLDQQAAAMSKGNSDLAFGFHCTTTPDGKPDALAVDLLDDNHPLAPSREYCLRLAALAEKHGCRTGIRWKLGLVDVRSIDAAIARSQYGALVKIGMDPTHIEPAGITVGQAKKGARPW